MEAGLHGKLMGFVRLLMGLWLTNRVLLEKLFLEETLLGKIHTIE
jgi:hypothetical protein